VGEDQFIHQKMKKVCSMTIMILSAALKNEGYSESSAVVTEIHLIIHILGRETPHAWNEIVFMLGVELTTTENGPTLH